MAAPEYMNDLRKSSQLGFGVYSWLQLVDLVCRHDMSESITNCDTKKFFNRANLYFTITYTYIMITICKNLLFNVSR